MSSSVSADRVETVLASIRLPDPDLLAPEHFPTALCELLNDRLAPGDPPWGFSAQGHLASGELTVRLAHLYRAYLASGNLDAVASAVDTRARNDVEEQFDGAEWDDVRPRLRVVLRRTDALRGLPVVQIPLANDLVACPVLDSADRMTYIPQVEAERWGIDARTLLTRAVATLDGPVSLVEIRDDESGSLLALQLDTRDGYDSGRLLCPNVRASVEAALGGPLIVAMPAAGLVLVGRAADSRGRRGARRAADQVGPLAGPAVRGRPRQRHRQHRSRCQGPTNPRADEDLRLVVEDRWTSRKRTIHHRRFQSLRDEGLRRHDRR